MQDNTIKQDALLRQLEALDEHISRASSPDHPSYSKWGEEWANKKRQQLWREYKLCPVIREKQ